METEWITVAPNADEVSDVDGLPGVRIEAAPVYTDPRGSLHELWRSDEVPPGYEPRMACASWSVPGCTRGPHEHEIQDDYFTFAGPSDFRVALWDARSGGVGAAKGWTFILLWGPHPRGGSLFPGASCMPTEMLDPSLA